MEHERTPKDYIFRFANLRNINYVKHCSTLLKFIAWILAACVIFSVLNVSLAYETNRTFREQIMLQR
jgi:hypothetical protein